MADPAWRDYHRRVPGLVSSAHALCAWALLLAVIAGALVSGTAHADVRTEARRYFRQGMAFIEAGEVDRGIELLERAYETLPHPNVLYNIARAQAEVGRYDSAIEHFERYLESDPQDREEVQGFIAAIRARMAAEAQRERERAAREEAPEPPEPAPAIGPAATDEEILAIEESATQIAALAEATQSDSLRVRAERLRELAGSLRRRSQAASGGREGDPTQTAHTRREDQPDPAGEGAEDQAIDLGGEAAGDVYEERIVSASRFAQSPLDAPNSTTIVTAQDIRLTGLTNPASLLRRAAGVEVMELAPEYYDVSIRGLNQRISNKVLVLVDGRSVYLDFLGATFWNLLPLAVEDLERIEIIRGPASALYGADAFTGIINLITRDPSDGASWVSIGAGNGDSLRAATSLGGRSDALSYRFGGGYAQTDHYDTIVDPARVDVEPFADEPDRAFSKKWFSSELRYRLDRGFVARAGVAVSADVDASLQGISRLRNVSIREALFSQSFVSVTAPFGVSLRSFWNRLSAAAAQSALVPGGINVISDTLTQDVFDVELEYARELDLGVPQNVAIGVGYRFKSIQGWAWLDDDHTQHHLSAYLQDILQVADPLRVQLSVRADRHPLLAGVQLSPRGSIVYRPTEGSAVRGTVGYAFRSPTFLESYLELANPTPVRGVTAYGVGNTDLEPERITSFELGYAISESDYFALEANVYYNLVDNLILFTDVDRFTLDEIARGDDYSAYDDGAAAFPVSTLAFENEENATFAQIGGEVGVRVFPVTGLDVYANYAYHDTSPTRDDVVQGPRADEQRTSTHKVNVGVQYRSSFGLDVSVDLHWVSRQVWVEQVLDVAQGVRFERFELPSYTLLSARVGYRLIEDRLELGIVGTNLVDPNHREHPFGERVDTRVVGTARVSF